MPKKRSRLSEEIIQQQYALIEAAALANERCPKREPYGPLIGAAIDQMYARGMIKGEISGRNFRRMTLLVGKHAGRQTMADPTGYRVSKTIGGAFDPDKVRKSLFRGLSAKSRTLTREELERQ